MEEVAVAIRKYGYNSLIIAATNGFLVKVGCQLFVKEGKIEDLTPLLTRYYNIDEKLPEEFGRKSNNSYLTSFHQQYGQEVPVGCPSSIEAPPAFGWLKGTSEYLLTSTYKAANGIITVNHETGEVLVQEKPNA